MIQVLRPTARSELISARTFEDTFGSSLAPDRSGDTGRARRLARCGAG